MHFLLTFSPNKPPVIPPEPDENELDILDEKLRNGEKVRISQKPRKEEEDEED